MVQSTGIRIKEFYIPPFTVDKGETLIIQLPNGLPFTELLFMLVDILTGREKADSVVVKEDFQFAKHITETGWTRIFRPLTVGRYIKDAANPDSKVPNAIYELTDIKPTTKIKRLGGNQRKLLSLLTAFSWTNNIIFDLVGVDPVGGQKAYDLVKEQIGNTGIAILVDNYDDFKDDCTKFVKFEMVPA